MNCQLALRIYTLTVADLVYTKTPYSCRKHLLRETLKRVESVFVLDPIRNQN